MAHIQAHLMNSGNMAKLITRLLNLQVKQLQEHSMFEEHGDYIYLGVERSCLFFSSAIPRKSKYSSGTDITKEGMWGERFDVKRHGVPYMIVPFTVARLRALESYQHFRQGRVYKLNKKEFLVRLQHEVALRSTLARAGVQGYDPIL